MKAFILKGFGGVENLIEVELPIPVINNNEVLVKINTISVNPVDVKTVKGMGMAKRLQVFDPVIVGWDISGVVTEVGEAVNDFKIGDEVFGMVNFPGHGKAYAAYVAAPAAHLALKPSNISHNEAAAATLAALTAYQALIIHAKIKKDDRVLIHAASGGVGHFAVQIAKHVGACVIGTSSAENKDFVLSLGADEHIDYKNQRLQDVTKDIDFVLDTIGGENIDTSLEVIKKGGTIISLPSGLKEAVVEKAKAKGINGYSIMVQSNGEDMKAIAQLLQQGIVKPHVSKTFPFDKIRDAHLQVGSGKTRGKVVVQMDN